MSERRVVLICHESEVAAPIAQALEKTGAVRVQTVAQVQEALELLKQQEFGLILVYLTGTNDRTKADELLWSCSTIRRPLPVVACERYDEADALTLFQMGVTEYLSLSDHRDQLPEVAARIIGRLWSDRRGGR